MPTFSYDLQGTATQVELGNDGTILDASRLIERRGQNVALANNFAQTPLTIGNGLTVDVPVCSVGNVINSLTHVYFVLLVSSTSGRASVVLLRTYARGTTGAVVHSTQINTTSNTWFFTLSLNQFITGNDVFWRIQNNTGTTVQYSVGLRTDRHNL